MAPIPTLTEDDEFPDSEGTIPYDRPAATSVSKPASPETPLAWTRSPVSATDRRYRTPAADGGNLRPISPPPQLLVRAAKGRFDEETKIVAGADSDAEHTTPRAWDGRQDGRLRPAMTRRWLAVVDSSSVHVGIGHGVFAPRASSPRFRQGSRRSLGVCLRPLQICATAPLRPRIPTTYFGSSFFAHGRPARDVGWRLSALPRLERGHGPTRPDANTGKYYSRVR